MDKSRCSIPKPRKIDPYYNRMIDLFKTKTEKQAKRIKELGTEKKELRDAMLNMCFCKRHICKRCAYVEEIPDRCKNEQIRDRIFRKLSKP